MTLAAEIKFLLDVATAGRVRAWARARLEPDPHGQGPSRDEYRTRTLYFDTAAFDTFHQRGSYGRSKYRLRQYDGTAAVFFERKLRRAARLTKRRTTLPIDELLALDGRAGESLPAPWFERRVQLRGLRPVCQISYSRMARTTMRGGEAIRLTIDDHIHAARQTSPLFIDGAGLLILPQQMVLELKYSGATPSIFKELVETFRIAPVPVSKYRVAAAALDLVPDRSATLYA